MNTMDFEFDEVELSQVDAIAKRACDENPDMLAGYGIVAGSQPGTIKVCYHVPDAVYLDDERGSQLFDMLFCDYHCPEDA